MNASETYDPLVSDGVTPTHSPPPSYWHATHMPTQYAPLAGNVSTDYLVIGGGYTGLSAAITLAEQQKDVVVIDSNALGFGCAGRNGGFILSGSGRLSLNAIAEKWGTTVADGMHNEFTEAISLLESRIDRYTMQVDYTPGDYIKIGHTAKATKTLFNAANAQRNRYGDTLENVSYNELSKRLTIVGSHGAVVQPGACLHPLKLADEYARVASHLGATLYYNSPALNITEFGNWFKVTTPQGEINTRHILIASNAYTPKTFHSLVDKRQFPVQSSIMVTDPLTKAQQDATGLCKPMSFMDTRMMKYYYRVLPDGRLLFGGRGAVTGKNANNTNERKRLYMAMVDSFPTLNGIGMPYFWSGWVSVALDSLPRVYVDSNKRMGYAMGYCGSGVSFAAHAGKRLAQRMLGEDIDHRLPIFSSPLPRYPFSAIRRVALHALYKWAKISNN
jgi:gamma-glutamylputrescine oxidase